MQPSNTAHVREWNKSEFRAYFESHGFEVIEHRLVPPFRTLGSLMMLKERWRLLRKFRPFKNLQRILCRLRP